MRALVEKSGGNLEAIEELVLDGQLKSIEYAGEVFYVRAF
jgi:hypothetical protein